MAHAEEAYPLQWPVGWPRVRYASRSKFGRRTMYVAREFLEHELRLLGARGIVLSTNVPLRQDGLPYSNAAEPRDHGAAVYFRIKDQPRVLACDKWDRVADNVMAIAKHIEAIRGQVRWGVGSVEQALGGYKALPEMGARKAWWEVLGIPQAAPWGEVERRRQELLGVHHPDKGGAPGRAAEINAAFDEARAERAA